MEKRGATVAVIGDGGRESAAVHAYLKSPHVERVLAIPGNDMMQELYPGKKVEAYPKVKTTDAIAIRNVCISERVALADVMQDNAVEAGVVNLIEALRINTVGPTREAGALEWDKTYGRWFAKAQGIEQPNFRVFGDIEKAKDYLKNKFGKSENLKLFIKAAGLARGKGVISAETCNQALRAINKLKIDFPDAMKQFLIEDAVTGEEFSSFAALDGENFVILGHAQDHKRALDHDRGENTGGMGTVSNPLIMKNHLLKRNVIDIVSRTLEGQKIAKHPYKGVLFIGGMKSEENNSPYLIEYNARWGDPEAQVIIPGLDIDFFELSMAIAEGKLAKLNYNKDQVKIYDDKQVRVAVTGAARGYPGDVKKFQGKEIFGFDEARKIDGVTIYGAAVKIVDGKYYVNGGRLFYAVGKGQNVLEAREKAYAAMSMIKIEGNGLHYRNDIVKGDMARLQKNVV